MEKQNKVTFIHSISVKVALLTSGAVILAVIVCMVSASIKSKDVVSDVYGRNSQ